MLSDKVHFLIKSLNASHVGLRVIRKFYFLSTAYALCTPVEVSHIYRTSYLARDSMETCLPSLCRLAGAFRSKSKVNDRCSLHFIDNAEGYAAASLSVYRYASKLAEKPSERAPEKLALDHAVRLAAYRHIIEVRNCEIPDGSMRDSKNYTFVFRDYWLYCCPAKFTE